MNKQTSKSECVICGATQEEILSIPRIPVVQHRVHSLREQARSIRREDINLYWCPNCGFVNNTNYKYYDTCYDENYQYDPSNSPAYHVAAREAIEVIKRNTSGNSKIVEIGCGKGCFLEYLRDEGYDVTGFDPAYEGDKEYIHKCYFDSELLDKPADLIIFRHVLEHIPSPMEILRELKEAGHKKVYFEVPCFDWILSHNAFWEICYEHCNYFSASKTEQWFNTSSKGWVFERQLFYIIAELKDLKDRIGTAEDNLPIGLEGFNESRRLLKSFINSRKLIIWGAGAKAVMLANQFDPECSQIQAMIDINPNKQNKYCAGTGHIILSPEDAFGKYPEIKDVLIMNNAYYDEISALCPPGINISTVENLCN